MVRELIDLEVEAWNVGLIRQCFKEEDGNVILGLPISLVGCKDRVIWHYSRNEDHTVSTRYEVAMEMQENGELGRKWIGGSSWQDVPNYGVLKINCDGAWCGKTLKGRYGWVLRDFAELLQAAGGEGDLFYNNVAMAEAATIHAGLKVCIEMGCDEVEIESDSQVIISMLNKEYVVDAILECFIHDIGVSIKRSEVCPHMLPRLAWKCFLLGCSWSEVFI
ncbi:hypothetical protein D8674_019778 [Pyrus ussuriensis x Pyrus communis]|uniref:RNase H type-1 domain-containing protein n=1 Tax=Pyrus ussuriensis x Pyrus communis TaxID=2448454 RepID=A0A5N5G8P9_9ROSA|nr:hypothetical protein D8674_019778 [Pyrus ussuriensis x Pyrus communis]